MITFGTCEYGGKFPKLGTRLCRLCAEAMQLFCCWRGHERETQGTKLAYTSTFFGLSCIPSIICLIALCMSSVTSIAADGWRSHGRQQHHKPQALTLRLSKMVGCRATGDLFDFAKHVTQLAPLEALWLAKNWCPRDIRGGKLGKWIGGCAVQFPVKDSALSQSRLFDNCRLCEVLHQ